MMNVQKPAGSLPGEMEEFMTAFDCSHLRNRARTLYHGSSPAYGKLALIYALVTLGINLVVLFLSQYLMNAVDKLDGLSHAGSRSTLTSIATFLPLIASLVLIVLDAGFSGAVLDTVRGQPVSGRHLLSAFPQSHKIILTGVKMVLWLIPITYLTAMLVASFLTPTLMAQSPELMLEFSQTTSYNRQMELMSAMLTPRFVNLMMVGMMVPMAGGILFLYFRRRLAFFCLHDHPDVPAGFLARGSIGLLKGFSFQFFRLDLGYWWYYLLSGIATVLPLADITWFSGLPISGEAMGMILSILSAVLTAALYYYCKPRLWLTYALAYEEIRTRKQEEAGRQEETQNTL